MLRRSFVFGLCAFGVSGSAFARPRELFTPSCILRASPGGEWFILEDETHEAFGFKGVTQHSDRIQAHFSSEITGWRPYSKAGAVQITTDDGLAGSVLPSANLGLSSVTIYLRAYPDIRPTDPVIDPCRIWEFAPDPANGNLWVTANNMVV